ncbi:hypothetical protein [Pelagibacterium montanilacus]|uniref:hypothetical protein n=1 Tax=Pelagibacterium montanilacus TaxID=2185280 RepID=UPI0013E0851B|nr:hypothetical protein [Pelagibacterium montanilacus]
MKRVRAVLALSLALAGLLAALPVRATTPEIQRALANAMSGEGNGPSAPTAETRLALADAALAYWRNFADRLPALTSGQEALVAERDAFVFTLDPAADNRFHELNASPAIALDALIDSVAGCVADHEALVPAVGGDERAEAVAWLGIVHCYFSARYSYWLARADLDGGGVAGTFKMQYFGMMLEEVSTRIAPALSAGR